MIIDNLKPQIHNKMANMDGSKMIQIGHLEFSVREWIMHVFKTKTSVYDLTLFEAKMIAIALNLSFDLWQLPGELLELNALDI